MSTKAVQKDYTVEQLKEELQKIKSSSKKDHSKIEEIAKSCASHKQWDLATEAFQLIGDEKERNFLIADLIEGFLLPARELAQAKKIAKYLVEEHEMQPLILIRICLAEKDQTQAVKIAKTLSSPLSRNFAFIQIIESYLIEGQKSKASEACKLILENTRTIYDGKVRSYILRDIAVDLYFANHEKELAKEAALLIPDEAMKTLALNKIGAPLPK
jgi:hypothetical protein